MVTIYQIKKKGFDVKNKKHQGKANMKRKMMMMLFCVLLLFNCGCAKQDSVSDKKKIVVVLKSLSSEYWSYVAAGAQAAGNDLGVEVMVKGSQSETAYEEHNNIIETLVMAGDLDALVISPLQPDSVKNVLKDVKCPVLFIDTDAEYEDKISYIGTSNYDSAYKGGQYAAKLVNKEGAKAVIIGGTQGNTSTDERVNGYTDALKAAGISIESVQYADGLADKAASIMENLFISLNGDIDIVMCNNDEIASGVSKVVAELGKKDVIIVGFDGIQAGVQNVIDGKVTCTVAQSPFEMGYLAVENAVAAANGETIEKKIVTEVTLVTQENAESYMEILKTNLEKFK